MRKYVKMRHKKKSIVILKYTGASAMALMTLLMLGLFWSGNGLINHKEAAASQKAETVDLRIIGTTDLHGQINSKDYEQGVDYNNGGLARVIDLINTAREELPASNTITLDAGDVLFDYTTEYIFSENQQAIQPIYKAMALIGYDAITLGNHDFDYGYDYILRQLDGSGLRNITVVSNVMDSKTGDYPFLENMLITKRMMTSAGNEVEIKIGIIGQTIPVLTGKTHSYKGILKTEDMVENAEKQAAKLKEMGADIVIALSHTGMGPEEPERNFKNVAYALTKIDDIDVVVCGHEHNMFPTSDMTSPYYKLPGVDKSTFLINDTNVIMAGDRGRAIGVVDLTLEVNKDTVEIAQRSSELRMVTASKTKENTTIASMYGEWEEKLLEYSTEILGKLDKDVVIQNYYGLLGDNPAIQLLNNSKLNYALRYVNTIGTEYKDYPIIAASSYASFGANSIEDYVNIHDEITESDLSAIQPYNSYLYLYTITGGQLREWLEWSASAYENTKTSVKWKDSTMSGLMKENNIKSLIKEDWLEDWSSFTIFDGIDYVIDPSMEARYDFSGNRISSNRRIASMKYNGVDITEDMVFVLATNKITKPTEANQGVEQQVAMKGFVRSQSVLAKFIEEISTNGDILPMVDNNWKVNLPYNYQFLVKLPYYGKAIFEQTPWYVSELTEKNQYKYYISKYPKEEQDDIGPNILASPFVTSATARSYNVGVLVSDASEIKMARVVSGDYDLSYTGWIGGRDVLNKSFTVWENGIYSIYAEDIHGNRTVKRLVINNFNDNLLATPTVVTYTNRKTKISGKAEPNKTIIFEAYTGIYETSTGISGSFSYKLPAQPSGTIINVYIVDKEKGLESERLQIPVKRTGPNQPSINPIANNMNLIHGLANDKDAQVIAIVGDYVYVSENGGAELYKMNTEIYNKSLKIIETNAGVEESGYYYISVPPIDAGTSITVYNLDHLSRNSRAASTTVTEAGPNAPIVYDVSNIEKTLSGYIPDTSGKTYRINIGIGDTTYSTTTDKRGSFTFDFKEQLRAGQIITVLATETKNGSIRYSYETEVVVKDINNYVTADESDLVLNKVTNQSNVISGFYYDGGTVYLAIAEGEGENFTNSIHVLDTDYLYKFRYELPQKLQVDTVIYVMTRFVDGRILKANTITVLPGIPNMPTLVNEVANTDKVVKVKADKGAEVILTIGTKTYSSKEYIYDESTRGYIHTIPIDRALSGTEISVVAINVSGSSDVFTSAVIKTAPDAPEINGVKVGDTTITGKIELYNYIPTSDTTMVDENTGEMPVSEEEAVPVEFQDAPAKVAESQTRIYAKIGKKTYEGTINNKGSFTITVPKQKKGTKISVWGTNKAGRGPLNKVTVVDSSK